jgi:hypothetical protein
MHKNDSEIHSMFGKLYVWGETPAGNLTLISVERLEQALEQLESSDA